MKTILLAFTMLTLVHVAFSQSIIRFSPGPGKNDGSDEGGLTSGKDAFVYDEQYATNYGTSTVFVTSPISTCNQTNLRAFVKFDLSSLPESVDSVFLGFYMHAYTNYCYSNCDNTFDLRFITSWWDELTLNWNNMPAAGIPFSDTVRITFPYFGGWLRFNITDAYKAWKSGSVVNEGFTIFPIDGWCNNASVSFATYSSDFVDDTTSRPYLEIFTGELSAINETKGFISNVSAFPNPAHDDLTIEFATKKPEKCTLEIIDYSGKIVENRSFTSVATGTNLIRIPVTNYKTGVYVYRICSQYGYATGRFIVNH